MNREKSDVVMSTALTAYHHIIHSLADQKMADESSVLSVICTLVGVVTEQSAEPEVARELVSEMAPPMGQCAIKAMKEMGAQEVNFNATTN